MALNDLSERLRGQGGDVFPVAADITGYEAVRCAVEQGAAKFGKIDILVNNAGWDLAKPFLETGPDLWDKIIAINLRGPLNLHKAVLPHMIAGGGGTVINIASDAGRVGSSGEAVYSACKGGLIAFSKTIAREYARNNIRVNVVCPGPDRHGVAAFVPRRWRVRAEAVRRACGSRSRSNVWGSRTTFRDWSPSCPATTRVS